MRYAFCVFLKSRLNPLLAGVHCWRIFASMPAMLQVNNLSKKFGDFQAVDDLSFTVHAGDVYGFLGQNGAGKSTTLRMMLTLIKPSAGEILFEGKNIYQHRNHWLSQAGAVIERPDLYKYLSAYDNLRIFAKLSGIKATRALMMEKLKLVGLEDRAGSKVKTYSQGMKQRLGIAVALVHDPQLIMLDEPTNGLDPQGIADMRNLIKNLSTEHGKTVIVSSHLLHEIEQVATRMIIINRGKKIVEGVVKELLDPAKSVVQLHTDNDEKTLTELLASDIYKDTALVGGTIKIEMDKNDIPDLILFLQAHDIRILSVQPLHSLEDYFLTLTNADNHVEPASN